METDCLLPKTIHSVGITLNELMLISFVAKDLIRGLLRTDPDERLTINEVMQCKWISVSISFDPLSIFCLGDSLFPHFLLGTTFCFLIGPDLK